MTYVHWSLLLETFCIVLFLNIKPFQQVTIYAGNILVKTHNYYFYEGYYYSLLIGRCTRLSLLLLNTAFCYRKSKHHKVNISDILSQKNQLDF